MNLIDEIKIKYPLKEYISQVTGREWKNAGSWFDLQKCIFCGHKDFMLSPQGTAFCFCCRTFSADSIQFRRQFEQITWKQALDKFREEMGIKKYDKKEIDWISLRESACDFLKETLFESSTKYQFRGQNLTPIQYLTEYRKHSFEAVLHFRLGFNDGKLIEHLKTEFSKEAVEASGLGIIPAGCFSYPFIVNGEIKYFRIKDPNKIKMVQMPLALRSRNAIWYNQDVISEGKELWVGEGEDDIISLWDCGQSAVASCGNLTLNQVNYLKSYNFFCIYSVFDNDAIKKVDGRLTIPAGKMDTDTLVRNYENTNLFIIDIPEGKDIDDLIREAENIEELIEKLKTHIIRPSPELTSLISEEPKGYFIRRISREGVSHPKRLTNWILIIEAVIIKNENEREKKVRLKVQNSEYSLYVPAEAFSSVAKLKEFLYNSVNRFPYFLGSDSDLTVLVQYWELIYNPKIVRELHVVGEIEEGFITSNIFVSNKNSEFKPLTNGFLDLGDNISVKIMDFVLEGGEKSLLPHFPLTEPQGGIEEFKKKIFALLVKNRNLKVAIAIGWLKAILWSSAFYDKFDFFPIMMFHGKYQGGKSKLAKWLMSMLGLRKMKGIPLRARGTTDVGLGNVCAFYSSLPVFCDDYRNTENEGQRFHTFFRNVFDRSFSPKGLKDSPGSIRTVVIRSAILITGETCPDDPGLNSRFLSIEITEAERNPRYWQEILKLEPQFAHIGLDWIKNRNYKVNEFLGYYDELEKDFIEKIKDTRQAQIWAMAVAGALTEKYFTSQKDFLIDFAVQLANAEILSRKQEELIGQLWEAADILHKKDKLDEQAIHYDPILGILAVNIPSLLGEIIGSPFCKKYNLPSNREVVKILKQEPYVIEQKNFRVKDKVAFRWILNIDQCPKVLKSMFLEGREEKADEI